MDRIVYMAELYDRPVCDCILALLSRQNSSQSSLDDSFDQFDGSELQSLQDQPLHRPQRGERSTPGVNPFCYVYMLNSKPGQYNKCYLYLELACMIEKSYTIFLSNSWCIGVSASIFAVSN